MIIYLLRCVVIIFFFFLTLWSLEEKSVGNAAQFLRLGSPRAIQNSVPKRVTECFNLRSAGLWCRGEVEEVWVWDCSEFSQSPVWAFVSSLVKSGPSYSSCLFHYVPGPAESFTPPSLCVCCSFCQECPSQIFALSSCPSSHVSFWKILPWPQC